jgi:NTE family protein
MTRKPASQSPPAGGTTLPQTRPTIALALGGGGARGLAHILMLEVFDEFGIKPVAIAGTSIGAIFGAAYASGLSAKTIRSHTEFVLSQRVDLLRRLFAARNEPIQRIFNIVQMRSALFNPETLLEIVLPKRIAKDFSELEIPLAVIAADFFTQSEVVISRGSVTQAVAASMALPVLFAPVMKDEHALMDGGLVNPLPFDLVMSAADITVAIDVSGAGRPLTERRAPSAFEALVNSSQILQHSIVREKLLSRQPDIYISVDVDRFHVLDFLRLKDVLKAAAPAQEALRRQLRRVLHAQTLPVVEPPTLQVKTDEAPVESPRRKAGGRFLTRRRRREA